MPSWNIHIHHAEAVLRDPSLGGKVRDPDAFLLGNCLPDLYVGYMVPNCSHLIPYRITHFTEPGPLPEPHYWEFWNEYALPPIAERRKADDLVLGAWAHLAADFAYNHAFNEFLARRGMKPSDAIRIKKQNDYDAYGKRLGISSIPQVSPMVLRECAAFPQYRIDEPDVRAMADVMGGIVEAAGSIGPASDHVYAFLTEELLEQSREAAEALIARGLSAFFNGDMESPGARPQG